ncbi:DUF2935 domain-containing protein [Clostridium saccharobutylicum]|uniref:DUF2935 domain-containing protein n=2 Tax=Clostridium saccharobutylicum TaxID=169679 RepID=U5MUZ3_CLOSA|nr:DUF2935 domain-containing protein [Clostridium saccharobutylicum]AGX43451.1 hypothetical protein CLSA_c24770 [Clostridium saccharobutylicum DSM 13864]AQR90749.1 hypothetical protein CLOSC_24700 [Clostridium saccharobutylicum]AQS00653.1 hypothetical protein CSACC_24770 [Clostridium saccharobutylicum]AQS10311.1 hypothetical protein CLOBY_24540 [Clostridium saccharobutylicum]AQS14636.1 hypothetical protein CLOSACC_24770 [Clostridium saccharobutylicum]
MLSNRKFIKQSLELHLFFTRIMKEHSFFLEVGFTPKDSNYIEMADAFRMEFDKLLADVISISEGVISNEVIESGEAVTQFTIAAEQASAYYTGVKIAVNLTKVESKLMGYSLNRDGCDALEQKVFDINDRAMELTRGLIEYKSKLLSDVLSCNVFTVNYPLLIDHILREAKLYYILVKRLQNREEIDIDKEAYEQEVFWNRIMAEHSKFIRGLLDPTEDDLINTANNFGHQFDELEKDAKQAMDESMSNSQLTNDSYKATLAIKKFKTQGTQGLLQCKIQSIIIPLLGDHVLREANHYLRLLRIFKKESDMNYD